MRFAEVDLFGVYVAPVFPMIVGAWFVLLPLRRIAYHFGLLRRLWHPTLFWSAAYVALLSSIVLLVAG